MSLTSYKHQTGLLTSTPFTPAKVFLKNTPLEGVPASSRSLDMSISTTKQNAAGREDQVIRM